MHEDFRKIADLVQLLHPIGIHRDLTDAEVPHCLREILEGFTQDMDPDEGSRHRTSRRIDILNALIRTREYLYDY